MFKNLTAGQWTVFILLTCITFFGGFLYLAAEAYFNRKDRDFAVTPVGAAYMEQEAADRTTRNDAQHVGLTMEKKGSFWDKEVSAPKAALILAGVALGPILLLNAGRPPDHPVQARERATVQAKPTEAEAKPDCDRLRTAIDARDYKIRTFRTAQSQVLSAQIDPRFDDMARKWQVELAGWIIDYRERCVPR